MVGAMTDIQRTEILEAAAEGIRKYLRSTRGAHYCGPGTSVCVDAETKRIEVHCQVDTEGGPTVQSVLYIDASWNPPPNPGEGYTIRRESARHWRIFYNGARTAYSGDTYAEAEGMVRRLVETHKVETRG